MGKYIASTSMYGGPGNFKASLDRQSWGRILFYKHCSRFGDGWTEYQLARWWHALSDAEREQWYKTKYLDPTPKP